MTVEVRPVTPADIETYAVEQSPYRVRGYVGLLDGEIIGIGGVAYLPNGEVVAFLNVEQAAREKAPIALTKIAKRVVRDAHARGIKGINAMCDDAVPSAARFLKRLGFKHMGDNLYRHEVT